MREFRKFGFAALCVGTMLGAGLAAVGAGDAPLGLPEVPVPADNPMSEAKVALGEKLFNDPRFSKTGEVMCATCHDPAKAFTDSPLRVSEGINKLTGTRNAPTVVNAAYMPLQFWDGREPDLEHQSLQPFLNPVEMGLEDHEPILEIVRSDPDYAASFKAVFGVEGTGITADHVAKAIAAFERTVVSGNSPFDRWYFGGDEGAVSEAAKRGLDVYVGQGRCVSCHTISQNFALFTDGRFHNINVNFAKIAGAVDDRRTALARRTAAGESVDDIVLSDADLSELGRFAVTGELHNVGSFKTPTLRNIAVTAPYMHDGSLKTLAEVVTFYNNGGRLKEDDPINDFQSGGIRPLNLTDQQQADLVAFLEALTSPQYAPAQE